MIDILHINDFLNISNSVAFVNYCNTLTLQSATIICRKEEIWNLQVLPSTLRKLSYTHILILNSRILFYDLWKLRTINTWLFVRKYVIVWLKIQFIFKVQCVPPKIGNRFFIKFCSKFHRNDL